MTDDKEPVRRKEDMAPGDHRTNGTGPGRGADDIGSRRGTVDTDSMRLTGSTVVSAFCLAPRGAAADGLPGAAPEALAGVPGFAFSRFAPLVHAVVRGCLDLKTPADGHVLEPDTPIILATQFGDAVTVDGPMLRAIGGKRPNALWFFQSATTSVLSRLTRHYGLDGQLTCISTIDDPAGEALRMAELMFSADETEHVLIIGAELAPNDRVACATARLWELDGADTRSPEGDAAAALLLRRKNPAQPTGPDDLMPKRPVDPALAGRLGWLTPLFELCVEYGASTHHIATSLRGTE